jgi:hypothetical protein
MDLKKLIQKYQYKNKILFFIPGLGLTSSPCPLLPGEKGVIVFFI